MIKEIKEYFKKKQAWWNNISNSQHYKQEQKYLTDITFDFINTIRIIAMYSNRAPHIYNSFLTITTIDDLIESSMAILMMVNNGIHNASKRELRYILEMSVKYGVVDWTLMGKSLEDKIQHLDHNIPKSTISPIEDICMPFTEDVLIEFKTDVKRIYSQRCRYVHPSKEQLIEQLKNIKEGYTIGFESAEMFTKMNKAIFEVYDIILAILFSCFGNSMSGDIFEQVLDLNKKWKFHKGKYTSQISKVLHCSV
jgi:hypothetical protein